MRALLRQVKLSFVSRKCIWGAKMLESLHWACSCQSHRGGMDTSKGLSYVRDHNQKFTLTEVEKLHGEQRSLLRGGKNWQTMSINRLKTIFEEDHGGPWFAGENGRSIYHPRGKQLWWFIIQFWRWKTAMILVLKESDVTFACFFWLVPICRNHKFLGGVLCHYTTEYQEVR